jgi:hypothetical protein
VTRKEWLLLVLEAAEGQDLTPVQLQKSLFLVGKLLGADKERGFYEFIPYDYGPFAKDVYSDAESLESERMVRIDRIPARRWKEYSATPHGLKAAAEIEVDPKLRENVRKIVKWTRSLAFPDLVRSIYKHFPDYKANSVFQG